MDYIQSAAAMNAEESELAVFVINADWKEPHEFTLEVRGFEGWTFASHTVMFSDDPDARNTFEPPDVLLPRENHKARCEHGVCTAILPKLSWNMFLFKR